MQNLPGYDQWLTAPYEAACRAQEEYIERFNAALENLWITVKDELAGEKLAYAYDATDLFAEVIKQVAMARKGGDKAKAFDAIESLIESRLLEKEAERLAGRG